MRDFLVTAEDCGVAPANPADSDLQALTRHVAMGVVYSRQRRESTQQQRHVRRTAAFGSTSSGERNIRRRYNSSDDRLHTPDNHSTTSDTFVDSAFGELNQVLPDAYITLDDDEIMAAPQPSTTQATRSVSIPAPETGSNLEALALANAAAFGELPPFINDNQITNSPEQIDFSALGAEEIPDHPSA